MVKNLLKNLIVVVFLLMPLLMVSNNPAAADSTDKTLTTVRFYPSEAEDFTVDIYPCDNILPPSLECIVITIANDNGVDLDKTEYGIEKDGTDITGTLECEKEGQGTTSGSITCCKSGGLDEGGYITEVAPADMEGNIGTEVSCAFTVSTCTPEVTISPSSISLTPSETQRFSAATTCNMIEPTYAWEYDFACIGSTVDGSGLYWAGKPKLGTTSCTDKITVTDTANGNLSDTATITVSTPSTNICTSELIYGEHSKEAKLLRGFRDKVLSKTPAGQALVRLYYEWSPGIVKAMNKNKKYKKVVKKMIDGVLPLIRRVV